MHTDYLSPCFQNLRDQLIDAASREQIADAADRAESALYEIQPARGYYCRDIACQLLGDGCLSPPNVAISGEAAEHDLRRLIEDLSEAANLRDDEAGQAVHTVDELSRMFDVSTKTISRWRAKGLVSRRFLFEGRTRIGFLRSSVERFVKANAALVRRGHRFRQLSPAERKAITQEARRLAQSGVTRSEVTKRIARHTGRSVETIRYTLNKFQRNNPHEPIFGHDLGRLSHEIKAEILRQYRQGTPIDTLAKQFGWTSLFIKRVVDQMRAQRLMELPLDYVHHDDFKRAGAEPEILVPPPQPTKAARKARRSSNLPAYLASLYEVPLLTRQQEFYLFRKFNYLKYKATKWRERLSTNCPSGELLDQIERSYGEAVETKNAIIRANLRLVVAFARRRARIPQELFELISDGNMSLMRAVEKFDCSRGFKFSTYATSALLKNHARSTSDRIRDAARFPTSLNDVLAARADYRRDELKEEHEQRLREQRVARMLSRLGNREREIIIRRFGLNYEQEPRTLQHLGTELGISKERVRQLEARAFQILRSAAREEPINMSDDFPGNRDRP